MLSSIFTRRSFSTALFCCQKASPLAALRKKTGYSFTLCKKALDSSDQNVETAEQWLNEQALAQGWNKANKLQLRNAAQGLIGLCLKQNSASMIELNCETDFVARNEKFQELLAKISRAAICLAPKATNDQEPAVLDVGAEQLAKVEADGMTLADLVALEIGQIGENIVLKRGVTMTVPDNFKIAGSTHPCVNAKGTKLGRFGTLLAYSRDAQAGSIPEDHTEESLTEQFCQHIIGMNPKSIGDMSTYTPEEKPEEGIVNSIARKDGTASVERDEEGDEIDPEVVALDSRKAKDSEELIHQEYLLDNERKFGDILLQTGLEVKYFVRIEVGQDS